jgi:RNA polymerase sigma factor
MVEHRMDRELISKSFRNLQNEISEYKHLLEEFRISFNELTQSCPSNANKRQEAIKLAKIISGNAHLANHLKETKQLPMKELEKFVSFDKSIRKYHKYIIAMSLIYIGGFTCLKEYLYSG